MKRHKHDRIKKEKPETSSSFTKASQEHDLAYYIHDRVELMHQVFSVLKVKDIKAMAPESVRKLPVDDLQELCTEELLGISSKRLCAILDGAEPPSDTESSSQSPSPELETISLDSISSDEEILSQGSSKRKKHKHHRRGSRSKTKRKKSKSVSEEADQSKASRAGLTVLELLELQARARAIRAQLQQEQVKKAAAEPAASTGGDSSDDDVEIKEERPEVVEISSDEEKPSTQELERALQQTENQKQGSTSLEANPNTNKKDKKKKDKHKEKHKNKEKEKVNSAPIQNNESKNKDDTVTEAIANKPNEKDSEKDSHTVTRRINDLIITVPQQHSKKIKLNRSKPTTSTTVINNTNKQTEIITMNSRETENNTRKEVVITKSNVPDKPQTANKEKRKDKKNKNKKQKKKDKNEEKDSDHDEITLQLSDSEKMDLLEDFDRKNYDCVSSSSEDSESSSDTSEESSANESDKEEIQNDSKNDEIDSSDKKDNDNQTETIHSTDINEAVIEAEEKITENEDSSSSKIETDTIDTVDKSQNEESISESTTCIDIIDNRNVETNVSNDAQKFNKKKSYEVENMEVESNIAITKQDESKNLAEVMVHETGQAKKNMENDTTDKSAENLSIPLNSEQHCDNSNVLDEQAPKDVINDREETSIVNNVQENIETIINSQNVEKEENCETGTKVDKAISEGELSDNPSSEIEAIDVQPEVVCISDEESKAEKKKKKKDKKSKKEKKSKKSKSDFRNSDDQNFYRIEKSPKNSNNTITDMQIINLDKQNDKQEIFGDITKENTYDDDVYEILELSDDSSCYEVEGTVLSKEPTAEEIEALSAKIDEIEREEVVTEEQIREHERRIKESKKDSEETISKSNTNDNDEDIENISWKDRYLGSKKVKRVLTTSNIMNALRKKNKELKKKLEDSKKREAEEKRKKEEESKQVVVETKELEEGSIEQYNTLQGSTKYVDPVPDPAEKPKETNDSDMNTADSQNLESTDELSQKNVDIEVSGEMKKDAKLLLKIYKKLLKYNDITKVKDHNKKKKKSKKKKEKANEETKSV